MSGYEKSPDYGGDKCSWWANVVAIVLVGALVTGLIALLT